MSYLLDTNVVSEVRRRSAAPQVVAWMRSARREETFVSALVLGEVRRGIERLRVRDPTQAAILEQWLTSLHQQFANRIIPIDVEIAEEWGRISAAAGVPAVDGLMAATAKVRGLVFVTRNVADVAGTGAALLDPWSPVS